jgi:hypothetical protein
MEVKKTHGKMPRVPWDIQLQACLADLEGVSEYRFGEHGRSLYKQILRSIICGVR